METVMNTGLFDAHGGTDPTLNGIESRTLRAMTHLERRHVALLCEIIQGRPCTTERITSWETGDRGYPADLVVHLRDIAEAIHEMATQLVLTARREGDRATLIRPKGSMRIMEMLKLPEMADLYLTDRHLKALEEGGGDFWQRLCDAAMVEAASLLAQDVDNVHVEIDRAAPATPGGAPGRILRPA